MQNNTTNNETKPQTTGEKKEWTVPALEAVDIAGQTENNLAAGSDGPMNS